jgi:hypothetical protein
MHRNYVVVRLRYEICTAATACIICSCVRRYYSVVYITPSAVLTLVITALRSVNKT